MRLTDASTLRPALRLGSQVGATLVGSAGLLVLAGWVFDAPSLESLVAGWPLMVPATAACFVVTAAALLLSAPPERPEPAPMERTSRAKRLWSEGLAGAATVVGLLRLGVYVTGWPLDLDHLGLFAPASGSMSPATAFGFVSLGGAVWLANRPRCSRLFQVFALLAAFNAWLGLSRYIYGGVPLMPYSQMAVHTAAAFMVLSVSALWLRTDGGLMELMVSDSAGGQIARYLLLPVLTVPIAVEWLQKQIEQAGWFSSEASLSLAAFSDLLVLGALVWATGAALDRTDTKRKQAERKLLTQNERLSLLNDITTAIGRHQDLRSIFQIAVGSVEGNLPADFCAICYAAEPESGTQVTCVSSKAQREEGASKPACAPILEPGALSADARRELLYTAELSGTSGPLAERLVAMGMGSLVTAPLKLEERTMGLLLAARRRHHGFSSGDCEFLRQLSEHVALAAHQAQLRSDLQQAYDDLKQSRQAVIHQERLRMLGEMTSGIAHDINNAISPALLSTDLLLADAAGLDTGKQETLQVIRRAVHNVSQTVARLRDFYRQREPQTTLFPIDLNALVPQVINLTEAKWRTVALAQGVEIDVRTELEPSLPRILGVESDLRDALTNLVFNAIDAMPNGGTLTLRTRVHGGREADARGGVSSEVHIEVSDTGVGMTEEIRARCLELFFTTKGDRGTGLGLAMVHGAAQRHKAEVEIESAPGEGTTFRLRFSVPPNSADRPVKAAEVESRPARPLQILVVDDDPLVLRMLESVLRLDGHKVTVSDGGQAGIADFCKALKAGSAFDVVITDLGMPTVDGHKVAAAVKAVSATTPVILLTGWGAPIQSESEAASGVDRVLGKPPKIQDLRAALAAVIKG